VALRQTPADPLTGLESATAKMLALGGEDLDLLRALAVERARLLEALAEQYSLHNGVSESGTGRLEALAGQTGALLEAVCRHREEITAKLRDLHRQSIVARAYLGGA
jgi:hypothetical protein